MLNEAERSSILDAEVERYVIQGYRVTARTATTAQLIRPKTFNIVAAILWLLLLVVGLLIYLLIYAAQSDEAVYLSVDPDGRVERRLSGGASRGQDDPTRWICDQCGHRNPPRRPRCKRCEAVRP